MRAFLALVVFGATVGTLLDALHTFSGTTEYTPPFVLRTAWWVPFLFASAYGLGGFLYAVGHRQLRGPATVRTWNELGVGLGIFAALYAASAYLPASNVVKAVVLGAGAFALWAWLDRSIQGIALACVAALAGPFTEIVLIRVGVFRHRQPDFWGIPLWLPALYLASGPSFGQLARRVIRMHER
ncbi:MAG: hypothetical protein ACXWUG_07130 [Polyangiales bacterium]